MIRQARDVFILDLFAFMATLHEGDGLAPKMNESKGLLCTHSFYVYSQFLPVKSQSNNLSEDRCKQRVDKEDQNNREVDTGFRCG